MESQRSRSTFYINDGPSVEKTKTSAKKKLNYSKMLRSASVQQYDTARARESDLSVDIRGKDYIRAQLIASEIGQQEQDCSTNFTNMHLGQASPKASKITVAGEIERCVNKMDRFKDNSSKSVSGFFSGHGQIENLVNFDENL